MKRILLGLLGMVVAAGMATSSFAAVLTLDYPISVFVASDPIDLRGVTTEVSFGIVGWEMSVVSNNPGGQPRSTVNNVGYADVDYTVAASIANTITAANVWTLGNPPVAANNAVLYGVFARALEVDGQYGWELDPVADFGAEDILLGGAAALPATNTVVAIDAESNTIEVKGNFVFSTQSYRSVRYRLDTPVELGSHAEPQVITITIGAIAL